MSATELADLVARDRALPAMSVVLDAEARRDVLGRSSEVTRIRYKPGSSIVAALRTETVPGHWSTGWIAAYSDNTKLTKTLARATRAGFAAHVVHALPGVIVGETAADRLLCAPMAALRQHAPQLFAQAILLRHNPHRRAVFRSGLAGRPVILKVQGASRSQPATNPASGNRQRALTSLERVGVPVLRPTMLTGVPGGETLPWWGDGDLATMPLTAAAHTAGRDLALLHQDNLGASPMSHPAARWSEDTDENASAVQSIATLLPALGARAAAVAARLRQAELTLPARRLTLVHGDFSPDQVLVGGPEIRLIDFDRCTVDHPERDLGSFLASADLSGQPELGSALLEGYLTGGGTVDSRQLHRFTATAFLQRAVDPFRALAPQWAEQTRRALKRAETEASQC